MTRHITPSEHCGWPTAKSPETDQNGGYANGRGERGDCGLRPARSGWLVYHGSVSEPGFAVRAEDQPAWAEIVRRAERGESIAVIAHGDHVADVVPSGELDRLRETIEVLSDTELVRDLQEGLADAHAGRVFSAGQVAADLAARRAADE